LVRKKRRRKKNGKSSRNAPQFDLESELKRMTGVDLTRIDGVKANTIQTVMKDARMREQADLIKKEVGALLNDVRLLADRVSKLQTHFNQADAGRSTNATHDGGVVSGVEREHDSGFFLLRRCDSAFEDRDLVAKAFRQRL
jgi:hypothetical protein